MYISQSHNVSEPTVIIDSTPAPHVDSLGEFTLILRDGYQSVFSIYMSVGDVQALAYECESALRTYADANE